MRHSYPWYIADWRDSETRLALSLAGRGLYRELLDYCYLEGSLPADESRIKLISSSDGHDFSRAWKQVRPLFELVSSPDGERFVHHKVNQVRAKLDLYYEQKKEAGRKSGEARAKPEMNGRSNERSNGEGTGVEPASTPTPTTTKEEPPKPPAPVGANTNGHHPKRKAHRTTEEVRKALGERTVWFDELWKVGPWTDGKLAGMDTYERRVDNHDLAVELYRGAKRYRAKCDADPTIKIKFLQGWINEERWIDENVIPNRPTREGNLYDGPEGTDGYKVL